jgi:hypothetical protein
MGQAGSIFSQDVANRITSAMEASRPLRERRRCVGYRPLEDGPLNIRGNSVHPTSGGRGIGAGGAGFSATL